MREGAGRIAKLTRKIENAKNHAERQRLTQERAAEISKKKKHEKEMDHKWPGWRNSRWDDGEMPPGIVMG